jgi:hypothetical protein
MDTWVVALSVTNIIMLASILYLVWEQSRAPTTKITYETGPYTPKPQLQRQMQILPPPEPLQNRRDFISQRDMLVIRDPLYPPLNRTEADTHADIHKEMLNRRLYVNTRGHQDQYRLVGYLVSEEQTATPDSGGNNWKLFARQKDRHSADFYMSPVNNNYDIKIPLEDNMVKGQKLRDVYTIPDQISFSSPLLSDAPYNFIELPKSDLTSTMYV